jgi:hypothetical protein
VTELYTTFKDQSEKKMNATMEANKDICSAVADKLASYGVRKIEEHMLEEIYEQEFVTPKLYLALQEELKK